MPNKILDEYTKHHGSAAYTVEHYDLDLTVKLASNLLDGRAVLQVRALEDLDAIALNLNGLKITKALYRGKKIAVSQRHHRMVLSRPAACRAG